MEKLIKYIKLSIKGFLFLIKNGPKALIEKIKEKKYLKYYQLNINQQYQIWLKKNYPSKKELEKQKKESKKFNYQPLISIITPVYNPYPEHLEECIKSVLSQTYQNWELCLVDDKSTDKKIKKILNKYTDVDKKIKVKFREKNGHICQASNDALEMAQGDYIALLDHDDFLWPNALYEVVKLLNQKPFAQFIYSDEDKIDYDGKTHVDPFFKPDWSPDYLRSINYITHFAVLKKSLIDKIGGFRLGTEGAQDWDLFLRASYWLEKNVGHCHPLDKKNPIQHISTILYSWRKTDKSTASEKHAGKVKNYAYTNQKKVLEDDLKRRGYRGEVLPTKYLGLWRVKYKIIGNPLVSIIIPTKDKYEYISQCLNSILKKTTYKNYELIIVDTGSTDKKVWQLYEKMKKTHQKTQVLKWNKKFNFSAVCNFGAEKSRGEYLLFLNNDTKVITPDWIERMLEHEQRKEIGTTGCALFYPDFKIQHYGGLLGIKGDPNEIGIAGHAYRGIEFKKSFIHFDKQAIKNYSFVTAACLMIKKVFFLKNKKFDENFVIAFNDIDLNLRLLQKNFFNVFTPFSQLFHYESVSVGHPSDKEKRDFNQWKKELKKFINLWDLLRINDPFFNKNFTREVFGQWFFILKK